MLGEAKVGMATSVAKEDTVMRSILNELSYENSRIDSYLKELETHATNLHVSVNSPQEKMGNGQNSDQPKQSTIVSMLWDQIYKMRESSQRLYEINQHIGQVI